MKVKMNELALENYGEQYRDKVYKVIHTATKYMPAHEFYAKGSPKGYHPGFESGFGPLYDLQDIETKENLPFSLYEWEVERA